MTFGLATIHAPTDVADLSVARDRRTADLRFELLGPVRAWRGGTELALGSPQQRTVLAALLLRDGALATVDELVRAVWGDEPPRTAINTVRTYVSRLRRLLAGAAEILSIGGGYALPVPAESLDVTRFRRHQARARDAREAGDPRTVAAELRAALDLHRGQPLAGASGAFADTQRTRLTQLLLAAELERLTAEMQLGRHDDAIPELTALAAEHPLREQIHELLMLALYRAGRQADALAAFQHARRMLADELGIDPGAGLRETHRRILAADPTLLGVPSTGRLMRLVAGGAEGTTTRTGWRGGRLPAGSARR